MTIVGIFAVYEPDWKRFREIMDDSDTNYETWAQWREGVADIKEKLLKAGTQAVEIYVDLDEFQEWCRRHGKKLNGESRAAFVSERLG